jgi:hypothetical protein
LSSDFYPSLLNYQATSEAGKLAKRKKVKQGGIYYYRSFNFAIDFYSECVVEETRIPSLENYPSGTLIFTDSTGWNEITERTKQAYALIGEFPGYSVTRLTYKFLNKNLRPSVLEKRYLLEKK